MYPFLKIFGFDKWCLSIPHILATILGFHLLYLICKQHFKTLAAYAITFSVVSFNATLVKHALEIRPYAVLPTLALAVFFFLHMFIEQNADISRQKKMMIGILLVMTIWFHHYGIFMVFFVLLYLFLTLEKKEAARKIIKDLIPFFTVVFLVAMPLWCYSTFGPHRSSDWLRIESTFQFIPNPMVNPVGFFKGVFCNLIGYKMFYSLILGLLFPLLIPLKDRYKLIMFFLVLILLPIGSIFLVDVMKTYWFLQRQFIWVMPFFAFLLGWCWDSGIVYFKNRSQKEVIR